MHTHSIVRLRWQPGSTNRLEAFIGGRVPLLHHKTLHAHIYASAFLTSLHSLDFPSSKLLRYAYFFSWTCVFNSTVTSVSAFHWSGKLLNQACPFSWTRNIKSKVMKSDHCFQIRAAHVISQQFGLENPFTLCVVCLNFFLWHLHLPASEWLGAVVKRTVNGHFVHYLLSHSAKTDNPKDYSAIRTVRSRISWNSAPVIHCS